MRTRSLCLLALALLAAPCALAQRAADEATAHLQRNAFRYGLSADDLADLAVTDAYTDRRSGTAYVYLRQRAHGIEIAEANFVVALDPAGRVGHAAGGGAAGLAERALAVAPSVPAEAAAEALARAAGLVPTEPFRVLTTEARARGGQALRLSDGGVAQEPVPARLVYHLDAADRLHLAWEVGLYERSSQHYWLGYVDATSGRVLAKTDLVAHDHFGPGTAPARYADGEAASPPHPHPPPTPPPSSSPSYRVYAAPAASPDDAKPAPPADGRTLVTDPADPLASPLGWHRISPQPGTLTTTLTTTTEGNNAHAYLDRDANNRPDPGGSPDGGRALRFDFPLDLRRDPNAYGPAAVTNLFYWNNLAHDVLWHYGFDEWAGNFQTVNHGRGGLGGDAVRAEAQDGSGTDNANFYTPPDGEKPRMQMYAWDYTRVRRDSDLDNGIILHEYAHGVSNRLVGGPSNVTCLGIFSVQEQMGEGWSDLLALLLTTRPGDTRTTRRGLGTYVLGQPTTGSGVRVYPYSTDFADNPLTYASTQTAIIPHGVGAVWATVLWEVMWDLIDAYGFSRNVYDAGGTAGNQVMLNLVIGGMKLTRCDPGFVDARNGILAADQALYGGRYTELLWKGFARRGLGVGAEQGSSLTNTDNLEDFSVPEGIPPAPITDLAAAPTALGVALAWTATGDDGASGTAKRYDIRYSTTGPILTDAQFSVATQATGEPRPQAAGTREHFAIADLDFSTTYYFTVQATDDSGNPSGLSNPASATTRPPPVVAVPTAPIVVAVPSGQQATASFTIGNTGTSDLVWGVAFDAPPASPWTPLRAGPDEEKPPAQLGVNVEGTAAARSGPPLRRGGPDAYGYRWTDSDDPAGPAYDFVDIAETGTALEFGDKYRQEVTLPFRFPFYGSRHTTATVWTSGFLQFGPPSSFFFSFLNKPIPDPQRPDSYVAPFWTSLDFPKEGKARYQDLGDGRFVVQWTDVTKSGSAGPIEGFYTFQVILYASGKVLFQYRRMDGELAEATVGIEAPAAATGLEIAYNEPYVRSGLAVRLVASWATAAPETGRTASGEEERVTVTFDAAGLAPGLYTAEMTVASNDPARPAVAVPLVLRVTAPGLAAADGPDGGPAPADTTASALARAAAEEDAAPWLSEAYPNPFRSAATLTLRLGRGQEHATVEVFDALGRRVAVLHDGPLPPGPHPLRLDGRGLAPGTYLVRATAGGPAAGAGQALVLSRRVTLTR